jgi:hypothetical protein
MLPHARQANSALYANLAKALFARIVRIPHCHGRVSGRTFNPNSSTNHPFPFPSLALPWRGAILRRLILASFVK